MRSRIAALTLIGVATCAGVAFSQTYPSSNRPVPRTTSAPVLRALAIQREVHERFRIGLDAEQHRNWNAAAAEFERIIALRPPEPQFSTAYYDLGIAYANAQRLDDAARAFQSAITGDPGFLAAMANLISVDLARHDLRGARAVADTFLRAAPDSARGLYSHGMVALQSGDYAAAQRDFGRLVQNDPQYAVAHYDFGLSQVRLGQYASAEHEFSVALDLAPDYARARFALGTVLLREGKRAEARAAFDRVARDPSGDPALQNLAVSMRDAIHAP
jgi:tetratricopeptide (TPR) repeat protein